MQCAADLTRKNQSAGYIVPSVSGLLKLPRIS